MRRSGKAHGKVLRLSETPLQRDIVTQSVTVCVCVRYVCVCVVHACHPMRSIERTIRIPSRRHREVEAGSTGNARMEFEIGCVSIAQYSYFLKKTILLCKVYTGSFHSCIIAARVPITQCAKHDKHGNERWSPHQTFVHLLHCMPVDAGQLAAGVAAGRHIFRARLGDSSRFAGGK